MNYDIPSDFRLEPPQEPQREGDERETWERELDRISGARAA